MPHSAIASQPQRPPTQPVDLSASLVNPTTQAVLVDFHVPAGMWFHCAGVSVVYSEPYLAVTRAIGWRVFVNESPPPYVRNTNHQWRFINCGDLGRLYEIHGINLPAASDVSLVIGPQVSFTDHVIITGRLVGSLYPAGKEA